MKPERLQELKDNVLGTVQIGEAEDIWDIAKELIAALEAAQAELAEAKVFETCTLKDFGEFHELVTNLRAQLTKTQAELALLHEVKNDLIWHENKVDTLRAQLDEAKSVLIGQREDRRFDRKRLVKIAKERDGLRKELDEVKSKAWKTVDLEEGNMLVFVGVHAVAWQQEWGEPKVGFTRWNDDND